MKIVTIIFSVYLLSLSAFPCADTVNYTEGEQTMISTTHDSHEHGQHDDLCAPFCSCLCCQTQVVETYSGSIQAPFIPYNGLAVGLILPYTDITSQPPIQPPQ